jgi:hypothetical protein
VEQDTKQALTHNAAHTALLESRVKREQIQLDHARLVAMCGGLDMVEYPMSFLLLPFFVTYPTYIHTQLIPTMIYFNDILSSSVIDQSRSS